MRLERRGLRSSPRKWRFMVGIRGKEARQGTDEEAAQEVLMKGFPSSLPHETQQPIAEFSRGWKSLTSILLVIKLLLSSNSFSAKSEWWEVSVTYYMMMPNLMEKLMKWIYSLFTYLNLLAFSSMICLKITARFHHCSFLLCNCVFLTQVIWNDVLRSLRSLL